MKKLFGIIAALIIAATGVQAETILIEANVNMENFWEKNGKDVEKVLAVGNKIVLANNLKRVNISIERTPNVINASTFAYNKSIYVSLGLLPYMDNDDEMAAVLSHEIAHAMLGYEGFLKLVAMGANSKKYEYQADLNGIDYMVKAGYNPIAMMTAVNKISAEPLWDWGFLSTHPKGSKRLLAMYKYIYTKYPQYLHSQMTQKPAYKTFYNAYRFDINKIEERVKKRQFVQKEDI